MQLTSRGTAFKIFILVLITGIIGVVGVGIMQRHITNMTNSYERMNDEYFDNCIKIGIVNSRLLTHRSVLTEMITSYQENYSFDEKKSELEQLENEIREIMSELSERMDSGEREQLYHKLYSNVEGYFNSAENTCDIIRDGNINTAVYYINNDIKVNAEAIDESMQNMISLTENEMNQAEENTSKIMSRTGRTKVFCIIMITAAVVVCIFSCVSLASQLEKYKNKLEKELESKTKELIAHNEKVIKIQDNTISGLANLIESRDGETGGHIIRTSRYVSMLANAAKDEGVCPEILTNEYIELLVRAAPLHDIGKIGVSDLILKKQGKLTIEEFDIMKTHASEGGKIVRNVMHDMENEDYINMAAQVAEGHHEKWNGSGYPNGTSGEDIPLCARIMALADVFDALVSKRCYKDAFSFDKAFKIIEESSGTHFDPTLAEIFLKIRPQIEAAAIELADE